MRFGFFFLEASNTWSHPLYYVSFLLHMMIVIMFDNLLCGQEKFAAHARFARGQIISNATISRPPTDHESVHARSCATFSFWLSTIDCRRVIRVRLAMSSVMYDYIDGVVSDSIRWDADSLGYDWAAFYGLRFFFSEEETRVAG
jgi:hypothetical protein